MPVIRDLGRGLIGEQLRLLHQVGVKEFIDFVMGIGIGQIGGDNPTERQHGYDECKKAVPKRKRF
jgi:hypothetical protein